MQSSPEVGDVFCSLQMNQVAAIYVVVGLDSSLGSYTICAHHVAGKRSWRFVVPHGAVFDWEDLEHIGSMGEVE